MAKNRWKEVEEVILSQGAEAVRQVDPKNVRTGEWVRLKCQYGCSGYGKCLTCPPISPTPSQTRRLLDEYSVGFVTYWGRKWPGRKVLAGIEREAFLKGWYKAFIMGSGPCDLCERCDVDNECRHPHLARPAMEACGIDVFQTARDAGFPIEVVTRRKEKPNFYSLLLVE